MTCKPEYFQTSIFNNDFPFPLSPQTVFFLSPSVLNILSLTSITSFSSSSSHFFLLFSSSFSSPSPLFRLLPPPHPPSPVQSLQGVRDPKLHPVQDRAEGGHQALLALFRHPALVEPRRLDEGAGSNSGWNECPEGGPGVRHPHRDSVRALSEGGDRAQQVSGKLGCLLCVRCGRVRVPIGWTRWVALLGRSVRACESSE